MSNPTPPALWHDQARAIRQRINEGAPLDSLIQELARLQGTVEALATEVRVLRAQHTLRDILLPQAQVAYKGLNSARIDAAMPLRAEQGFYGMEYDSFGQSFRWTGPSPVFHFDLHLDRSGPLCMAILVSAGPNAKARSLRAFSDGVELPLERRATSGGDEYTAVLLPRGILGVTRLAFMPPGMFRPASGGQEDLRELGVVFKELVVTPASDDEAQSYLQRCDDITRLRLIAPSAGGDPHVVPLPASNGEVSGEGA